MDDAVKIKNENGRLKTSKRAKKSRSVYKYLYQPELQRTRPGSEVVGYVCRVLAAWLAVWGLLLFINDAFAFEVGSGYLALASLIPVSVLAIASTNGLGAVVALGISAASAAIYVISTQSPVSFAYAAVISLYNGMCERLESSGYRSPGVINIGSSLPQFDNSDFLRAGLVYVGILLAVIITLSAVKKVRMLPITVAGGVICVFVFTYNLVGRSWGFTLMVTALCGLTVMRAYEVFFRESRRPSPGRIKKSGGRTDAGSPPDDTAGTSDARRTGARSRRLFGGKAKGSALGGFAGLAAMALTFIVLLFPTLSINKKWEEIESINNRMEIARQIVSSVIIGDVPDFSDLGYLGQMDILSTRSTAASERFFTGARVMEVQANYNLPVYLRSFVSDTYDNDKWYAPFENKTNYFYQLFGSDFTGETVSKNFFNLIDPKLTSLNNYSNYVSRIEYGYVTTPVDVKLLSSSGNLLFMPSRYDPEVGLLAYGGAPGDAYGEEYAGYSDGIVSTSWLNFNKSYRALTFVQSFRHENAFSNLRSLDSYYQLCKYYIELSRSNPDADYREKAAADIASLGLDDYVRDNIYERWYALDEDGRTQLYAKFLLSDSYNDYVKNNYMGAANSESAAVATLAIIALSAKYPELNLSTAVSADDLIILSGGELISTASLQLSAISASLTTYDRVMAVIDYLKDNYTYTLSPKKPSSDKLDSVESFLSDTKEGYCVQFATAAALMLRTLGVPTRYCEGYIASEFELNSASDRIGRYTATVRDFNAHAWIEVYVDDIGWLTFETTPEYYSDMYEHYMPSGSSTSSGYETPDYTPPEDVDSNTSDSEGKVDVAELIAVIAGGLALAGALAVAAYFIFRFASASRDARYRRNGFIEKALRHELEGEERRGTAVAVIDYISAVLAVAGLRPSIGELPPEYRDRCGRVLRGEENAPKPRSSAVKLPPALNKIMAKLSTAFMKRSVKVKKSGSMGKTKTKATARKRAGSLGVADEFAGAKGELRPEEFRPEEQSSVYDYSEIFGSEIFGYIQSEEFGNGMESEQLRRCAEYLNTISDEVYKKLNPLSKFWFRHVRHAI